MLKKLRLLGLITCLLASASAGWGQNLTRGQLDSAIQVRLPTNGNQAITAVVLQQTLMLMTANTSLFTDFGTGVMTALAQALNSTGGIPGINGVMTAGHCLQWSASGIQDSGAACVGGGTVTSVGLGFSGGLISVSGSPITTAGAFTLSVAGTSGGIPYFATGTSWASSGQLAANALMIGGGAGGAPSTTTTGAGVLTALGIAPNTSGGMALVSGLQTVGNCLKWGASGIVDNGAPCGGGGGSGTVTSVAQTFTGGLISVSGSPITTAGTLALTVAGTSGGIPYFNSATSWASSGVLAVNSLMIGGGAGVAPSTVTTGSGVLTALGNSADANGGVVLVSGVQTNNNCLKWSATGGVADAGAACGTVTSVGQSFTGGLISVSGSPVTSSGTLALTVAGTSGGIPYFSSASTWASSGALTAGLPVIGGGAGLAPSVGTRSGNTTQYVTTTGAQTNGDCVKIDANGNHVANGAACGTGGGAIVPSQLRITLTSNTPVLTGSVTGATTVYCTPYVGNSVAIWNGSAFVSTSVSEMSQATTDATKSPAAVGASSNYDLFVWDDTGTKRCTRGPAWSTATTRGTGAGTTELQYTSGILNNKNAITNGPGAGAGTYIGTIRSNGSSTIDFIYGAGAAGGTAGVLHVWNYYNRVLVSTNVSDTTASWTYNSATARITDNSAGNRINFISGMAEDGIQASLVQNMQTPATAGNYCVAGIGLDQTTTLDNFGLIETAGNFALTSTGATVGYYAPQLGSHFISGIEATGGAYTCTYWGGSGGQNGANPNTLKFMFKM